MDDDYWEGYFDDDPVETDELDEWGCLFGDKCLMPGEHLKKECHTAEMMEQDNDLNWVHQIPEEQIDLIGKLLYAGFRYECPNLREEEKELMHKFFDLMYQKRA